MENVAAPVAVEAVELIRIHLPLVAPFRTSFGTETRRDVLLVHVLAGDTEGWGECVAMQEPLYSSEYVAAAQRVVMDHLLPRLLAEPVTAQQVARVLEPVRGHRMAKAALEAAWLDAQLRRENRSFAQALGAVRDRVPSGVSVGIMASIPELLDAVAGYREQGYVRIKLKIEPGWDVEPVRAVRERFGDIPLQVDANTAYTLDDAQHLARLDEFGLLLIEQPLPEEQVLAHAKLARTVRTPICLDESIVSAVVAAEAIEMQACSIVNIKPGRAGGYLEATRIHDLCVDRGVAVWCGGMLETGIGRAANLALAALPGFTLPGDTSASDRYFREDVTAPFVLARDGTIAVPTGAGIGVEVRRDVIDGLATSTETVRPG
ncbi:MAG TPA: o-succinylbenzoate synthase [Candidatus Dormibacteraeota bacterium]|nr:o-succinylbenzoate synthase [Candidatus Dormibacteraeota bacterium]